MSIPTPFNPLGTLGSELPLGYVPVDSVYISGLAVDTGISARAGDGYTTVVSMYTPPGSAIGCLNSWVGRMRKNVIYAYYNKTDFSGIQTSTENMIIKIGPDALTVNGTPIAPGSVTPGGTWRICGYNAYTKGPNRFWSCTIERGGEIIRKYLPARRLSDGLLGIYDVKTKKELVFDTMITP